VHVDYATQKRLPKSSAEWFAGVIASNTITSPELEPVDPATALRRRTG
jgi:beta-glucosidase/6-phospho-beta-glucosidase/beta-galactosidase